MIRQSHVYDQCVASSNREGMDHVLGAPLRPDAQAKVTEVLIAADRLLRTDPTATLEQIAQAAGVSRATIYRRFPTRQDLLTALSRWAVGRVVAALQDAQIGTVPPYVALYQATRNVIDVKVSLKYTRTLAPADDEIVAGLQEQMRDLATALLKQCQDARIISPDADLSWARAAYHALIQEVTSPYELPENERSTEQLATQVVNTFLHGLGSPDRVPPSTGG